MLQAWFQSNVTPFRVAPAVAKYLAVGNAGTLMTSDDGATWTTRTSGFGTSNIYSLAYGNGMYVAVGQNGKVASSPDGITWTVATISSSGVHFMAVEFFAGTFVVASNSTFCFSSTNGTNWTSRTQPSGAAVQQGSGNNGTIALFAGGATQQSALVAGATGTITTVEMGFGGQYYGQWAAYYGNGMWFGGGQAFKISTSPSAGSGTWTLRKGVDANPDSCVRDFVYDKYRLKYVAVGGNAAQGTSPPGLISVSTNGLSWPTASNTSASIGNVPLSTAAVSQEAGYVGAGNGIWKTTDWSTFTRVATSTAINHIYIRQDM